MKKPSNKAPVLTMGLDMSDRTSQACVVDTASGEVLERFGVATTTAALGRRFAERERMRVVIEASGHSPWVSRLLKGCGHEVIVANPRRVALIAGGETKTDRTDAETLARLGRVDPELLHPIHHRSEAAQQDLALLRSRDQLVRARTSLINHVRGAVKSMGGRLAASTAPAFATKAALPPPLEEALRPLVETIAALTTSIAELDKKIEQLCETRYPATRLLQQVSGVGPVTSLAYVLTLDRPERFRRSRQVGAYLGLRPRISQSGDVDRQLRITKAGDDFLRRLLVGSAHYILGPFGPDCTLRRVGLRLAATGGMAGKKRAIVAVARRLAVLLHHLWRSGEVYEPLRHAPPDPAATAT